MSTLAKFSLPVNSGGRAQTQCSAPLLCFSNGLAAVLQIPLKYSNRNSVKNNFLCSAIMENRIEIPQKIKHITTMCSINPTSPKRKTEYQRYLCTYLLQH